jgi:hypothetical protein
VDRLEVFHEDGKIGGRKLEKEKNQDNSWMILLEYLRR